MSGGWTQSAGDLGGSLASELRRLQNANPFEALGLGMDASVEQIRASFLALTKRYHPSRYARMDREIVRLANEVFLRIKDAYTRLSDEAGRQRVLEQLAPGPATGTVRSSAHAAPTARHAGAATRRGRAPTASTAPATASKTTSRSTVRGTPRTTPSRTAATLRGMRPATPRRHPPTDADELERGLQDTVRQRNEDYEMALRLLAQGRYQDARTVFHKIAADDPKTKKFRLQMHYAWGLEHEDAGAFDEARKEFERALQVDAQFKRAHEALDRLPDAKKGNGLFKKFFGR